MIIQNIYLERYDWRATIYYSASKYFANRIIEDIINIGCDSIELNKIIDFLYNMKENSGLTYTNPECKTSILVLGETSCAAEFQNTFDHEKGHLAMHICQICDIDPFSEEYQYLVGSIGKKMFPAAKTFLCDICRGDQK